MRVVRVVYRVDFRILFSPISRFYWVLPSFFFKDDKSLRVLNRVDYIGLT